MLELSSSRTDPIDNLHKIYQIGIKKSTHLPGPKVLANRCLGSRRHFDGNSYRFPSVGHQKMHRLSLKKAKIHCRMRFAEL